MNNKSKHLEKIFLLTCIKSARVAQWIRRRSPKPKIGGSSPPSGTTNFDEIILRF